MPAASFMVSQMHRRGALEPMARKLFLVLACGLLLSLNVAVLGDGAASVMDKDGDGKVSMEEFVEHAAEQQQVKIHP